MPGLGDFGIDLIPKSRLFSEENDMVTEPAPRSTRRRWLTALVAALALICLCIAAIGIRGGYFYLRTAEVVVAGNGVEYVLDVSSRMDLPAEGSDSSRLIVARNVMAETIRPSRAEVAALRFFGSGATAQACQDTDLVVPLAPDNQARIAQELTAVRSGEAPDSALAEAMIAAIRDLAPVVGPRSLVVVTGGYDSCQAEAGRMVAQEAARAGIDLRTFVIGFQVAGTEAEAIKELVALTGNALYLDAPDEAALVAALQRVQTYVDNPTSENLAAVQQIAAEPVATVPDAALTVTAPPEAPPTPAITPPDHEATPLTTATATAEPDASPTPVVTPDPVHDYRAQSACDHPYFPLREGASWTYLQQSEGETFNWEWEVVEVTGDLAEAVAVVQANFDDEFFITYHWECTGEGVFSFDYGAIDFGAFDLEGITFSFDVVQSEGVMLPPQQEFIPGATWDNNYTVEAGFTFEGQSFSSTTQHDGSYRAVDFETVTVRAGTFETLRVEGRSSSTTTVFGQSTNYSSTSTQWYAYGVGWVRTTDTGLESSSTMELVSYHIPQ
jgi:hypothetical protein